MYSRTDIFVRFFKKVRSLFPNGKKPFDPSRALIQVGEYFPLKGFWFEVTDVKEKGITARVAGVTKKLKPILEAKQKQAIKGAK